MYIYYKYKYRTLRLSPIAFEYMNKYGLVLLSKC